MLMVPPWVEPPTDVEPCIEPDLHSTKVLSCYLSETMRLLQAAQDAMAGKFWLAGKQSWRGWVTLAAKAKQHCSELSTIPDGVGCKLYCVIPHAGGSSLPCSNSLKLVGDLPKPAEGLLSQSVGCMQPSQHKAKGGTWQCWLWRFPHG